MAKNPLAFQEDVMNLINKHYPGATKGNVEQNSLCANDLAIAMGGILAFSFRLGGPVIGRSVLQSMVHKIVEIATAVDKESGDTIRQSLAIVAPTTTTKQ